MLVLVLSYSVEMNILNVSPGLNVRLTFVMGSYKLSRKIRGYTHFGTNPLRSIPTSVLVPNVAPTSVLTMPTSVLAHFGPHPLRS